MAHRVIPIESWTVYLIARKEGLSINAAAAKAGISRATAMRMQDPTAKQSNEYRRARAVFDEQNPKAVVEQDGLCDEARRALNDFAYFRLRYFGRYSTPWQVHAANQIVELLASTEKEYLVENVAPGSGKSTLWHDIIVWLICRDRTIRIMIGSATEALAKQYGGRVLRTLERPGKLMNDSTLVERGLVADATGSLIEDFGSFKPLKRDRWRQEMFVVEQRGDVDIDQKEATVTTYGRDGGFLGGRFDLVLWDDLVTNRVLRTAESRELLITWWDGEAESRLEPGGVMVLQGQRLHANDLYRYCLDKREPTFDADGDLVEGGGETPTYRHIIYKAHHDEVCQGKHKRTDPAYDPANPDAGGCLLDPYRLGWKELQRKRAGNPERFLVLYQQEDTDPAEVLVNPLWISGGKDPESGEEFQGCWDHDRSCGVIPQGLTTPWTLIVTADPSPSKYWSIQMWLYHPPTEQRILIDHYRGRMEAPDFLQWDINRAEFVGLLETWWQAAFKQGAPFQWVVVEENAAQTFLLQYDHVKKWMAARSVQIIGHKTHGNKTSAEYGVWTVAPHWRHGRVRLPGNRFDGSRGKAMALVNEVKQWPESNTEDCVMAHWFAEYAWQKMIRGIVTRPTEPYRKQRPSWLGGRR